jgi:hypothetical protein
MASQGALDRQRIADKIVAAIRMHAHQVGPRLQEVFAPAVAEGEPVPDFVVFQEQLARYLEMQIAQMVEAEDVHLDELADDLAPRRRRDEAAQACRDSLIALRNTLSGAFGADFGDSLLGVEGRTPEDPLALFRLGRRALDRLTGDSLEIPPRRLNGFPVDLGALASQLAPVLDELGEALREVNEEDRRREATIHERDLALDAFDTAVGSVGRIAIAFDKLAGFPDFAGRIRFTLPVRRRRGTSSPDEAPPPDGGSESPPPDPDTEPPSGEPPAGPPTGLPEVPETSTP